MTLNSSRSSFSSLVMGGGVIAYCRRSLMALTHLLLILHWMGFSLVRHHCNIYISCGLIADMNEGMSGGEFLRLVLHSSGVFLLKF